VKQNNAKRLAVGAGVAFLLAGCGGGIQVGGDAAPKTAKAASGTLEVVLAEVGTIEPESRVEVKSLLGGKVKTVAVQPGETVKSGQVLALIEPDVDQIRNLSQLQTQLAKAKIEARNSEIDHASTVELAKRNFASAEEEREAERKNEAAKVDLSTLLTQVRLLEEGGISLSSSTEPGKLSTFKIIAPSDGVILESKIQAGEVVSSGTFAFGGGGSALFVLADLGKLVLKAAIHEVDIGKLAVGQKVTVTVDAFRGESFEAVVRRISPGARQNERVRVFDLEAKAEDPKGLLRPGMTANLDVHGEKKESVLKVPIEGVFRKKGKDVVYTVLRLDSKAKKKRIGEVVAAKTPVSGALLAGMDAKEKEVKTGLASVEEIEIVSGLAAGEEIFLEDPTLPKREQQGP